MLPIEICLEIIGDNIKVWRTLLAVPSFARWTLTDEGHEAAMRHIRPLITAYESLYEYIEPHMMNFGQDGYNTPFELTSIYLFRGRRHTLCGIPQSCPHGQYTWYRFGVLHRIDGPAVISKNRGEHYTAAWCIRGRLMCGATINDNDFAKFQWSHHPKIDIQKLTWEDFYG